MLEFSNEEANVSQLKEVAVKLFQKVGIDTRSAEVTADCLIFADRRGLTSHGVLRLPLYLSALEHGGINKLPNMKWNESGPSHGLLNADAGLGQAAMQAAIDKVLENIDSNPVMAIAIENSSHFGAGAFWSEQLTAEGLVAIVTSSTGPVVTPFGGNEKVLGTNPLTIAFPSTESGSLTADIATSAGAYGRIVAAEQMGEEIPKGWAVDNNGQETTDPAAALAGALLPFGGHKGSAISVVAEALSGAFSNSAYAYETVDIWQDPSSRMNIGHFILAINPAGFGGTQPLKEKVARLQQKVRGSGVAGKVFSPGDIEHHNSERNRETVKITATTMNEINTLIKHHGIK